MLLRRIVVPGGVSEATGCFGKNDKHTLWIVEMKVTLKRKNTAAGTFDLIISQR